MLVGEYCYEDDIAIQRAESRAIGKEEGISIGRNEGISIDKEEGISIGELNANLKTAKALKKTGIDITTISKCTGLSVEEVERL